MESTIKKVLVIGANSYIGRKFSEYVKGRNDKKIQVDMVTAANRGWKKVDLSKYDSVLHLAAIVHRKEKKHLKSLYDEVNHNLAVEVANNVKSSQVGQFIFMSTAAVFGNEVSCITKDTIPNPTTYYGKSKLAAEREIMNLSDKRFKVCIVRPPMVYGDGCKGNYSKLEKVARYTTVFPEFHNKRSVIHIDNLCEYLYNLIITELYGFFHPQDSEYMDTCKEIISIRSRIGKKVKLIKFPLFIINWLTNMLPSLQKLFGNYYYEIS